MKKLKYFILISILHSSLAFADDLHIFSVTKQENVGDKNQILGIVAEISSLYQEGQVIYKEFQFSPQDQKLLKTQIESEINLAGTKKDKFLFLGVGDYGIKAIQQATQVQSLKTCYLAHQLIPGIDQLIGKVDQIVLPQHSLNDHFTNQFKASKTKLTPIIGVIHHLKKADLIAAYQRNKEVIPKANKYLAIILAGDAQNSDGKIQFFKSDQAKKLAKFIGKRALKTNATVLILNGPRTGKYLPNEKLDLKAHRGGIIDSVTAAFMKQLSSLLPSEKIKLFDFQFDQMSYYQIVLGALLATPGELFVPGESTSMVSEAVDNLPGRVTLYENDAMNLAHQAHVQSEFRSGRANLLTKTFKYYQVQNKNLKSQDNSRIQLARELLRLLKLATPKFKYHHIPFTEAVSPVLDSTAHH